MLTIVIIINKSLIMILGGSQNKGYLSGVPIKRTTIY